MAKKLSPDGVPVDTPSTSAKQPSSLFAPETPGQDPPFYDEAPTRPVTRPPGTDPRLGGDEPQTVIAGGWRTSAATAEQEGMADPVVGWLVVVDGPGKGSSVQVGNGQNSIGRGPESRIRLDSGDPEISRNDHAVLTYDPRANQFYIQQGQGVNLVYLNGAPVLAPTPLEQGNRISVGRTELRFVAFCDEEFRWLDSQAAGE